MSQHSEKSTGSAGEPILEVDGLVVKYGAYIAIDNFECTLRGGRIQGLIGPNGAGKSSTFAGITASVPRSASIRLRGQDVAGWAPQRLAREGVRRTFQQNSFFIELTVLENAMSVMSGAAGVSMATSILAPWKERSGRRRCEQMARDLLERFGIGPRYHRMYPDKLPYGLQRVLSIALAYGSGLDVLLLDEPAAGVGGKDMDLLAQLLLDLRAEGLAIMLIEHHMDLLMAVSDHVTVIDRGTMIASDVPQAVQSDPRVLEAYLGDVA